MKLASMAAKIAQERQEADLSQWLAVVLLRPLCEAKEAVDGLPLPATEEEAIRQRLAKGENRAGHAGLGISGLQPCADGEQGGGQEKIRVDKET